MSARRGYNVHITSVQGRIADASGQRCSRWVVECSCPPAGRVAIAVCHGGASWIKTSEVIRAKRWGAMDDRNSKTRLCEVGRSKPMLEAVVTRGGSGGGTQSKRDTSEKYSILRARAT